jgi:hypothetical protein
MSRAAIPTLARTLKVLEICIDVSLPEGPGLFFPMDS